MEGILVIKRKIVRTSPKKKSLPDPEFDRISWAIKARSQESGTRRTIAAVLIGEQQIVATDGRILCAARLNTTYPDGCYDVLHASWKLIVLEKADVNYPDYKKVIPQDTAEISERVYGGMNGGFNLFLRKAYQHGAYALEFLQKAFFNDTLTIELRGGMLPLVIKDQEGNDWKRLALIMPIKE